MFRTLANPQRGFAAALFSTTARLRDSKTQFVFTSTRQAGAELQTRRWLVSAPDLRGPLGPIVPVLARLESGGSTPINLSTTNSPAGRFCPQRIARPKARPENLRKLIPRRVPSGRPIQDFPVAAF
jgi:hypothetical protein